MISKKNRKASRKEFKTKTILGLKWSLLNQVIVQGGNLIIGVLLARILSPNEFGLIAMITVLTGFINIFNDFGFGSALIQRKDISELDCSSVFWLNIFLGVLLTLLVFFLAPLFSAFYSRPILSSLVIYISFTFIISSTAIVQNALMLKALDFKRQFFINTGSVLISGIAAIIAALNGYGVWSLVLKILLYSGLNSVFLWMSSSWFPKFKFSVDSIKKMVGFVLPLFGTRTIGYWMRNLDNILIGRYIGEQALGYYGRAYSLMLLPITQISGIISRVLFPSFSSIQDDVEMIKKVYLKISRTIAFITFPLMLGLSVVSEPFVLTLLGEKWRDMITVLSILSILGATQSIGTLNGNIFLARNATKLQFYVGGVGRIILIIAIVIGLRFGIEGVALSYMCTSLLMMIPLYYFMGSLINLKVIEILKNLSSSFFLSVLMAGSVFVLDIYLVKIGVFPFLRLAIDVSFGVVVYGLSNFICKPLVYLEMKNLVQNKLKG